MSLPLWFSFSQIVKPDVNFHDQKFSSSAIPLPLITFCNLRYSQPIFISSYFPPHPLYISHTSPFSLSSDFQFPSTNLLSQRFHHHRNSDSYSAIDVTPPWALILPSITPPLTALLLFSSWAQNLERFMTLSSYHLLELSPMIGTLDDPVMPMLKSLHLLLISLDKLQIELM